MFGNMGDMMGMMGKIKDLQSRMKEAQEQLIHITASAEAGAGLVKVSVNGLKRVVSLEIDQELIQPGDKEMLQDLVVAATNMALENLEPKVKDHLQKATDGVLPNIPGLDFGNLFK